MDIFQTVSTAVHEIHVAFVFIKKVVDDVRSYDSDISDIQGDLTHEILFFEYFKTRLLAIQAGEQVFRQQSQVWQEDCQRSINRVSRLLDQYRIVAVRHDIDLSAPQMDGNDSPMHNSAKQISSQSAVARNENWLSAFNAKFSKKATELKKKAVDWSLFDKEVLEELAQKVRKSVKRLKETVTMMIGSLVKKPELVTFREDVAKGLSLKQAVKRQIVAQAATPDSVFGPLKGTMTDFTVVQTGFGTATYVEDSMKRAVVFEVKKYDLQLQEAVKSNQQSEIDAAMAPVRQLGWLLHESKFQEDVDSVNRADSSPEITGLEFVGYINQPDQLQTVFVYESPQRMDRFGLNPGSSITTLYNLINAAKSNNPELAAQQESLGNRYYIAHIVAATLLNIHSSLWVHKNIRSSVFIMQPTPNTKHPKRKTRPVPFVSGWGYARPEDSNFNTSLTADFEIVANLYRHPRRQGQPTVMFSMDHDLYSLGVVLVEIGLWKTVDKLFAAQIEECQSAKPPRAMADKYFLWWWKDQGRDLIVQSMGEAYAEVVDYCAREKQPSGTRETKLLNFRDRVVDILAKGLEL